MKYNAPKDCTGVTLLNAFYPAVNGVIDIPDHIYHTLEDQGFTRYVEPAASPVKPSFTADAAKVSG